MIDVEFTKERGKDRKPNMEVNLEEFIAIKGITALGNQLTKEKINQINILEPLPYEAPESIPAQDIEVIDEVAVSGDDEKPIEVELDPKPSTKDESNSEDKDPKSDENGQGSLF